MAHEREAAAHGSADRIRSRPGDHPSGVGRNSFVYMTSTEAQNGFGRVLDMVARGATALITKRNTTQAVVMSVEQYRALTGAPAVDMDALTAEFDALLDRLQTPQARAGLRDAFRASPEELSHAAVEAARRGESGEGTR